MKVGKKKSREGKFKTGNLKKKTVRIEISKSGEEVIQI